MHKTNCNQPRKKDFTKPSITFGKTRCSDCVFKGSWGQPCFITEVLLLLLLLLSNNNPGHKNRPEHFQILQHSRRVRFLTSHTSIFEPKLIWSTSLFLFRPRRHKDASLPGPNANSSWLSWVRGLAASLGSVGLKENKSHEFFFFLRCLKSIRALFLSPRPAKQPVDVCCISIKHSLFQRVHPVLTVSVWCGLNAANSGARASYGRCILLWLTWLWNPDSFTTKQREKWSAATSEKGRWRGKAPAFHIISGVCTHTHTHTKSFYFSFTGNISALPSVRKTVFISPDH